jgi:hypothetical protein
MTHTACDDERFLKFTPKNFRQISAGESISVLLRFPKRPKRGRSVRYFIFPLDFGVEKAEKTEMVRT